MDWIRGCAIAVIGLLLLGGGALLLADEVDTEIKRAEAELEGAKNAPAGGSGAATDPLSVDPDLAFWTLVVFLVLLFVLGKFAWKPMLEALETREHTIHEHIAAAERSHEEARSLLADYERKLAGAADQVKGMLEEARRDAEQTKQQILAEAKAGADAERARSLREVEAATDAALKQIAEQGANLAVELAGKIVGAKLNPADHSCLIADSVSKFPAASPSRN